MQSQFTNTSLMTAVITLYAAEASGHTSGSHSGGLLQQVMHILQSSDHLFIILALAVIVSLLLRRSLKHRD